MTANPNPTYDTLLDFWRAVRDADQECAELIEFNEAVGEALAAVGASMLHAKPIEQPLPAPPEPPRCPACGLTVGSVHTARPNWMVREGRISWCIRGAPAFALPPKCARRPHR